MKCMELFYGEAVYRCGFIIIYARCRMENFYD